MQEAILRFFQSVATPALDRFFTTATQLGQQTLIIIFVVLIYWCLDKKKGLVVSASLVSGLLGMGFLKALVRYPRPFVVLDSFEGKYTQTATGYSFPSGHSTTAAGFYSAVAFNFRKRGLSIVCALLIVLVGVSRLYLGVHWPLDVVGGWMLGITVTAALTGPLERLFSDRARTLRFSWRAGAVLGAVGLVLSALTAAGAADRVAFHDLCKTLGIAAGALAGFFLEEKVLGFEADGTFRERFFRGLIGVVAVFAIYGGLKAVFPKGNALFDWLRYAVVGFWAFGAYPVAGAKAGLFARKVKAA